MYLLYPNPFTIDKIQNSPDSLKTTEYNSKAGAMPNKYLRDHITSLLFI